MPTYTFKNLETGEEWTEFMSISARDKLLEDTNITQLIVSAPAIVSGVSGITHKNDSGFKDMMSRIAAANPTSPLADTYGSKGIKESKVREIVKKVKSKVK